MEDRSFPSWKRPVLHGLEVGGREEKERSVWDDTVEKWYFSIVDVVGVLTDSVNPATYWKVLKSRLKKEGNETVTNCNRLKFRAENGKMRLTDVADQEQLFSIIQSISSPKAEPFKIWTAKVAAERLDQIQDPERSMILSMLAKESTRQISASTLPKDMIEHHKVARSGGAVARNTRIEIARKIGHKVISPLNASDTGVLDVDSADLLP